MDDSGKEFQRILINHFRHLFSYKEKYKSDLKDFFLGFFYLRIGSLKKYGNFLTEKSPSLFPISGKKLGLTIFCLHTVLFNMLIHQTIGNIMETIAISPIGNDSDIINMSMGNLLANIPDCC